MSHIYFLCWGNSCVLRLKCTEICRWKSKWLIWMASKSVYCFLIDIMIQLWTEFIHMFLFFFLDADLSAPYPGVTSYDGISESSLERPEDSVSDVLFHYLVSNMENGDLERFIVHCQTTQNFRWFSLWKCRF